MAGIYNLAMVNTIPCMWVSCMCTAVLQVICDNVGTSFNLAKINTIPCMCAAVFSLRQQEDDWLHS